MCPFPSAADAGSPQPGDHPTKLEPADFRFIEAGASLPENIAVIDADTLPNALSAMFNRMASDPRVNFIVWQPPEGSAVIDPELAALAKRLRDDPGFDAFVACNGPLEPAQIGEAVAASLRLDIGNGHEPGAEGEPDFIRLKNLVADRTSELFSLATCCPDFSFTDMREGIVAGSATNFKDISAVKNHTAMFNEEVIGSSFHVDSSPTKSFRLLNSIRGTGTYVADNKDVDYIRRGDVAEYRKLAITRKFLNVAEGRFAATAPVIWVVPPGAIALMRAGGMHGDADWKPAFHSWPFASPVAPPGQKRVLERCDFDLK